MTKKPTTLKALKRQLEIEKALERVRERAMAMQNSEELQDVLSLLFQQYDVLEIQPVNVFLTLFDLPKDRFIYRASGKGGARAIGQQTVDLSETDQWKEVVNRFQKEESGATELIHYPKDTIPEIFEIFNEAFTAVPEEYQIRPEDFPEGIYSTHGHNKFGYLGVNHTRPCTEEEHQIIARFSKEFGQVYQRFLDIQKAEAQAREAQIEVALERIRARTMAMQHSEELNEVIGLLCEQYDFLGINPVCAHLTLMDIGNDRFSLRLTGKKGARNVGEQIIDVDAMEEWKESVEMWKASVPKSYRCLEYSKDSVVQLFEVLEDLTHTMPEAYRVGPADFPDGLYSCEGQNTFGYLGFNHFRPPTEEEIAIVVRFAREFERIYQRFLDLEKAEQQAREAQIEAALERVRARTMAMHQSSELQDVINTVYEQFLHLKLQITGGAFIAINSEIDTELVCWGAGGTAEYVEKVHLPYMDMPIYSEIVKGIKKGPGFFTESFTQEEKRSFFKELFRIPPYNKASAKRKKEVLSRPGGYTRSCVVSPYTSIFIINHHGRPFTKEENEILKRMGRVFEQTYTRFLDLQKAEAQAREAQIETALERVRAASMAMHNSSELYNVINILSEQLVQLGIQMDAAMINEKSKDSRDWYMWLAISSLSKEVYTRREQIHVPYLRCAAFDRIYRAEKEGKSMFSDQLTRAQKDLVFRHYFKNSNHSDLPKARKDFILSCPGLSRTTVISNSSFIQFYRYSLKAFKQEENEVLERFGQVFDQSYTRFLDLKKAEAQAREAQIEAALERIRARTMAMQESSELTEVLSVIFQQLKLLEVETVWTHLTLLHLDENAFTYRMTGRNGERIMAEEKIALDASEHWAHISDALKSPDTDPDPITRFEVPPEGLDAIWELFDGIFSKLPKGVKVSPADFPDGLYTTQAYCKFGFLGLNQTREATMEEADILLRFTTEFSRLYQRFLDLQNAEKRAREAQIEAALERIRARAMAMQHSEELNEVIGLLCEQYDFLGINPVCAHLSLIDLENHRFSLRLSGKKGARNVGEKIIDLDAMEEWKETVDRWKKSIPQSHQCLVYKGESLDQLLDVVDDLVQTMPKEYRIGPGDFPDGLYSCEGQNRFGYLGFNHSRPPTEEEISIVVRFAREFERIYQRFLDLEKAEAQAREAQIETALERVRARTMAMHKSEELGEVAAVLFEQIDSLGATLERLNIGIVREEEEVIEWWSTEQGGRQIDHLFKGSIHEPTTISKVYSAWKTGEKSLLIDQTGKELQDWILYVTNVIGLPFDKKLVHDRRVHSAAFFKHGALLVSTPEPLPVSSLNLLKRFSAVFEQTYTRFLDLQKAEQQAREAQIEAALERIRAKTMAMHNTDDIADTVVTFFEELISLGLDKSMRAGLGILSQSEHMQLWTASVPETSKTILHRGSLDMTTHPLLVGAKRAWDKADPCFTYILKGKDLKDYFRNLNEAPDYPTEFDLDKLPEIVNHRSIPFTDGFLFTFTESPLPEEIIHILERFAAVFGQTYTRYLDLQKAEERAREAVKQASIERVRGEISSMRSTADLQRITPLIWNELTELGVPFFRCGVFIVDEKEKKIHSYLSNPKGESLAAWEVRFGQIPVFDEMVKSWQKQEVFLIEWDRQGFLDFSQLLIEHGLVDDRERYQSGKDAPEHLVLHMLPFAQGMLYVGSQVHLDADQMEMVQALANAFSVAYARYEDFNQLEKTLVDLKATQAQLIQAEKMASLGELTAGIAHEIKNPLNFVNNFSDVTRELVEEMIEELKKGDMEEADAIARDVIQNLKKIVHHGHRADNIVKGMLQHSRSGDGKKEPTNLNELADEYLRLAYHGLRAKDKSFNVSMETDFDTSLEKADVVPQDIGRVLLNLLTNAFHTVNEKKASATGDYDPKVWVRTEKTAQGIEISVRDNGGGIPDTIVDKIFQPFFTTKPTGEGTGLGLSLSYDIVKAHGGELRVKTEEGKGTTFFITFKSNS